MSLQPDSLTPDQLVLLAQQQMVAPRGAPDRARFIANLTVERLTQAAYLHPLARLLVATNDQANTARLLWHALANADRAHPSEALNVFLALLADPEFEPLRWRYLECILTDACHDEAFRERQAVRRDALIASLPDRLDGEPKAQVILRQAASACRLGWVWATWGPQYGRLPDARPLHAQRDSALIVAYLCGVDNSEVGLPRVDDSEVIQVSDPTHVAWAIVMAWCRDEGADQIWAQQGPFPLPELTGSDPDTVRYIDRLSQDPDVPEDLRQACVTALSAHLGGGSREKAPLSHPHRLAQARQHDLAAQPASAQRPRRSRV